MTAPILVDLTVVPVLSFPMAVNGIVPVQRIEITSSARHAAARVRVTLTGAHGRPLALPVELIADLGGGTVLTTVPVRLDPDALAGPAEQVGRITVGVFAGPSEPGPSEPTPSDPTLSDPTPSAAPGADPGSSARLLASATVEVRVLAGRQWVATPTLLGLELLSAFVQPQDPALDAVLVTASNRMAGTTGRADLDGSTADPERIDALAAAVFGALADAGVELIAAPLGSTTSGQVVRTPAEVLDGRAGTSLDIALAYAAALERVGVAPVLWVTDHEVLAGYWREPHALSAAATTESDAVANLVDLSLVRIVRADPGLGFGRAVSEPVAALLNHPDREPTSNGGPGRIVGVVDVRQGRRDGIRALPTRVVAADGTVTVVEQAMAELPAVQAVAADTTTGSTAHRVPARVQQWKNNLLDLTLRNRLLNYRASSGINLAVPEGQLATIEDTVNAATPVTLLPRDRVTDLHRRQGISRGIDLPPAQLAEVFTGRRSLYTDVLADGYPARLRGLAHKARTVIDETGANNLYLALGTLLWQLDGRDLRSPLVLVPVHLQARARGREYQLVLDEAGISTPNFCLLEKLRQVHGLSVPGLAEPVEDDTGIDLAAALHAVRTAMAAAGLPYRVEETADLAILAFAKFRLWRDLDQHWSELARNPLVAHLIDSPTEPFADPVPLSGPADLDALAATCPVSADGSQLAAIADAVAGRTFVLEGPPGTGKSQTITNLLTRAVAEGRRVLFVAEKRAALDVVTRRLDAVGLGPFCLDLHDKASRPTTIRARVRAALDQQVSSDQQGMRVQSEILESARRRLSAYARTLHEPDASGLSYYSAHTAALAIGPEAPVLPVPTSMVVTPGAVARVRACLGTLIDDADPARPRADHPWGFADPPDPSAADQSTIRVAAVEFDRITAAGVTGPEVSAVLTLARTPADVAALATFAGAWAQNLTLLDETGTQAWRVAAAEVQQTVRAFAGAPHPAMTRALPQALELDVEDLQGRAAAAAGSNWFSRRRRQQDVLDDLTVALRQPIPRAELAALTSELVDLRHRVRALAEQANGLPGVTLPIDWNPLTELGLSQLDNQIGWLVWASDAVRVADGFGRPLAEPTPFATALRGFVSRAATASSADRATLDALASAARALQRAVDTPDDRIGRWAGDIGLLARWRTTAADRELGNEPPRTLRRWLSLLTHLQPLREAGADEARLALLDGRVRADDAVQAFDAGTVAAAMAERASATGLGGFEPSIHNRYIQRFTAASAAVRAELVRSIPEDLLASRSFDAHGVLGQIGELRRELVKRRGLPVRGLLGRYGELITTIMPCVLVSPDSLARFFPARAGLFDLVVFDEASQIRVADAIGAMGRARSVVVVGDSRQMPPTSFAEPGWDDDLGGATDDTLAVPDEESILTECIQAGVPQQWLSWHYRSQDEALIAFSNRHYYEDRLSSFPAPTVGAADPGPDGHGISLVRVDGEFQRSAAGKLLRTNPIEAVAVVTEIRRRFALDADRVPSIGVVTFNAQQRNHIEALLRDLGDERITEALDRTDGEGLFVKNLENVQGDERDAIFFSTAFSADDRGRLPLNFGPLNRTGGERRLNVAITRARRQVLVFCSFDPEHLRAEETSSIGVRHLRAYLEVAARGAAALVPSARPVPVDRHRDQIAAALAARGLGVEADVGLSDFRLDLVLREQPAGGAEPRTAVLLDGPGWAARGTVGDRDGLPVTVLGGLMRWPVVERVWMPEWLTEPGTVVDRLVERTVHRPADPGAPGSAREAAPTPDPAPDPAVAPITAPNALPTPEPATPRSGSPLVGPALSDFQLPDSALPGSAPSSSAPSDSPPSDSAPSRSAPSGLGPANFAGSASDLPGSTLPGETLFSAWHPGPAGDRGVLDRLTDQDATQQLWQVLVAGIEAEAPIHVDRLTRLAAGAFGLTRLTADRRAAVAACLPSGLPADPDGDPFVWPPGVDPLDWRGFRRSSDDARPVDQISITELANAAVALCRTAAGMTEDQLRLSALRIFGFARRTQERDARVDRAVTAAARRGRLTRAPDGIWQAV